MASGYGKFNNKVTEIFDDYNASLASSIVAWLVQKGLATEDQMGPLLDGSYKDDLPPEALRPKPTPNRTGLGDGSLWPDRMHLPRFDEGYFSLLGVSTSKLDRLHRLDRNRVNFLTVAELRARRQKALVDEYPRPPEVVKEALDAVGVVLRALPEEEGVDILKDERVDFLLTLINRLEALGEEWTEESLRRRLDQEKKWIRLDRPKHYADCAIVLYRIASLTHTGQFLRGYKSAMTRSRYGVEDEDHDAVLAKGLHNTQGVRIQLPKPADREDWAAGYTQGIGDFFSIRAASKEDPSDEL